ADLGRPVRRAAGLHRDPPGLAGDAGARPEDAGAGRARALPQLESRLSGLRERGEGRPKGRPFFFCYQALEGQAPEASAVYSAPSEGWMSGLSRTPGKRVGVNSPSGVRIPLPPPVAQPPCRAISVTPTTISAMPSQPPAPIVSPSQYRAISALMM